MKFFTRHILALFLATSGALFAYPNQTDTLSPILPSTTLPFDIIIREASFTLPNGIHSGAYAVYDGKWFFIAGRTNGMHGFNSITNNFPPKKQNTTAYVVDPKNQIVYSRSLMDPTSGLTQKQIDQLSVTSPQSFFLDNTLYVCGGYGIDTETGKFGTKSVLTAIDLPGFIDWVVNDHSHTCAVDHIRQTTHPLLKVTGGVMYPVNSDLSTLLIFGQNFEGFYHAKPDGDFTEGKYTRQVRRFQIIDNEVELCIRPEKSQEPDPNYRRRDLNVVPIIIDDVPSFVALSGVFLPGDDGGIWTVPVFIDNDGIATMPDPDSPATFKQGMNNYTSATVGLYSKSTKEMFIVLLGGISYGFFANGTFKTDTEFPFINQVTTVKIDQERNCSQYLMDHEYPLILSTGSNPDSPLLFGAGAYFIPADNVRCYSNEVIKLDRIKKPKVLGYIVGGIMSTLPNTSTQADSASSPYIFEVILTPKF